MICGPAAAAAPGLSGLTPAGKAPRRTKILLHAALLATTALVPALMARPAAAQTVNWDGSASNDWDTAGNWDTNAVPTAADDVVIDNTTINPAIIGATVNAQANGLTVGETGLPADRLWILSGGTLATTDPAFVGFAPGSAGSIIVAGTGRGVARKDHAGKLRRHPASGLIGRARHAPVATGGIFRMDAGGPGANDIPHQRP